jgi:hypothetical protein
VVCIFVATLMIWPHLRMKGGSGATPLEPDPRQ